MDNLIFRKIRKQIFKGLARIFGKSMHYPDRFGVLAGIILLAKLNYSKKDLIEVSLPKIRYPLKLRRHTSDVAVLEQIFLYEAYNFNIDFEPKLIIDGGAYVGYSAAFFANKFPAARIIALEPEAANFSLLKENVYNYQNVELINAGLWNTSTHLRINDVGLGHWGFMVEETTGGEKITVQSLTIGEILKQSGCQEIDILKLDIEGSEKEVFSSNYEDWLGKVNILIIELHERLRKGCRAAFSAAISRYKFKKYLRGENIILIRE